MKTIGVIGLGSIGMRHAKNLTAMGHTIISHDPKYSVLPDNLNYVLENSDAIVIASPTKHHFDQIMAARDLGKPVFAEKPIAHGYHSFLSDVKMVGYNLRFHSCVKKAKEWLDAGLIGDPLWANFTCAQYNDKPAYLRDGVILNWSHEIDLALYLLGSAKVEASATMAPGGRDDLTDIILSHDISGCRSSIHLDYVTQHPPNDRRFLIQGTKTRITADLDARRIFIGRNDLFEGGTLMFGDSFDENYVEEMQAFINRIDGKETIGCTGTEALKVLEICLEVRKQAGLV